MTKINIPKWVDYILNTLHEFKYEGFIVGGCVRDSLLNRTINDWDITTNALPDNVIEIFESLGCKVIPTGLQHGTVTIVIENNHYEITTYRQDGDYSDGRHPDKVEFTTSLKEDLSRRDFTINALAYNNKDGLIDCFEGVSDLNNKLIRCVGNPSERFNEDNLRRLRALRFACQLGFKIENETYNALSWNNQRLLLISKERIRDELSKILMSDNPSYGIREMWRLDILQYVIPELEECVGFNQHNKHHDKDIFEHILTVIDNTPKILELRLAALLHDIGKPLSFELGEDGVGHFIGHHIESEKIAEQILKRLRFDNKTIEKVCILVKEHMSRYDKLRTPNTKKFISRVGISNLDDLFELQMADIKGSAKEYQNFDNVLRLKEQCNRIINEKQPLSIKDLNINGSDLIGLGYKPGKELGDILKNLLEIVLETPELNTKDNLINLVKNMN